MRSIMRAKAEYLRVTENCPVLAYAWISSTSILKQLIHLLTSAAMSL
jgi:hypothetical protein